MGIRILALDQNLSTGWSITGGESGLLRLRQKGESGAGLAGLRLFSWIENTVRAQRIDLIAYENFISNNVGPGKAVQATVKAAIEIAAAKCEIPAVGYWPASVKLRATGSGKSDKAAMTAALVERIGAGAMLGCSTHDVVDAVWIRLLAEQDFSGCDCVMHAWIQIGAMEAARKAASAAERRRKNQAREAREAARKEKRLAREARAKKKAAGR